MSDVTNTPNDSGQTTTNNEEDAFEETIAGAMESFVPTLVFPFIQKVTEDMKENME